MTTEELIKKLSQYPKNTVVKVDVPNPDAEEWNNSRSIVAIDDFKSDNDKLIYICCD